ncbi:MAG TPA: hypothetical protein PLP17_02230, partial [Oligoflexia bacterium]|nr:hypothetical protein [Oligoflexia bacterium]
EFAHRDGLPRILLAAEQVMGFRGELALPPLGAAGLGGVRRRFFYRGIILVGDCVESMDPIGGMGMTHGLISSYFAAQALLQALSSAGSGERVFGGFEAKLSRTVKPLRGAARFTEFVLRRAPDHRLLRYLSRSSLPSLLREAACARGPAPSLKIALLRFIIGLNG